MPPPLRTDPMQRLDHPSLRLNPWQAVKWTVKDKPILIVDYAYLSVALPQVQCKFFAPWVRVNQFDGKDTMITGRRKPFLNSATHAEKIAAYEKAFARLQEQFAANRST
jgi:hypothetical protein